MTETSRQVSAVLPLWERSSAVARVVDLATRHLPLVDVAASAGARPFVVAALASRALASDGPPLLVIAATTREADDLAEALGASCAGRPRRHLPQLGDAAARAAQPPQRHRRAAASRSCDG